MLCTWVGFFGGAVRDMLVCATQAAAAAVAELLTLRARSLLTLRSRL
jgi:hypothetical protein